MTARVGVSRVERIVDVFGAGIKGGTEDANLQRSNLIGRACHEVRNRRDSKGRVLFDRPTGLDISRAVERIVNDLSAVRDHRLIAGDLAFFDIASQSLVEAR